MPRGGNSELNSMNYQNFKNNLAKYPSKPTSSNIWISVCHPSKKLALSLKKLSIL